MKLNELLNIISLTAKENKLSTPYLVGGFPRDVFLKKIDNINDIDITCGDASSLTLGQQIVKKIDQSMLTTYSDGHSKLVYENFNIDFSSSFRVPNIMNILKSKNIINPSPMDQEIYSRDFTINTLLMPLDLSTIIDTTNLAIKDLNNKILDTCLEPEITLKSDPRRIVRIIYLCIKLEFFPSQRLSSWVQNNAKLITEVDEDYVKQKINKAFTLNSSKSYKLLKHLNLWSYIPHTRVITDYLAISGAL